MTARAERYGWIPVYIDDVESDFSVFHRVDDPFDMDGPRFLRLAVRLPYYEGAVRASALQLAADTGNLPGVATSAAGQPVGTHRGPVTVNLPHKGPSPLPDGARYTESDPGSLMANPVFRDMFEFGRG